MTALAMALANKNARIIWALLTRGDNYRPSVSKQAEYMAATGFTLHPTIAFRSGLGPYKAQEASQAVAFLEADLFERLRCRPLFCSFGAPAAMC